MTETSQRNPDEQSFHGTVGAAEIAWDEEQYDRCIDALNAALTKARRERRESDE